MKHLLFLFTALLFAFSSFSQTVATQVTLTGSGTDSDGTVIGYSWTQVSGPSTAPKIVSPTSATTLVTGYSVPGVYVYALVVTDNQGAKSAPSQTTVTVLAANIPPVSNAGGNQTIQLPPATGMNLQPFNYDAKEETVFYPSGQIPKQYDK